MYLCTRKYNNLIDNADLVQTKLDLFNLEKVYCSFSDIELITLFRIQAESWCGSSLE